MTLAGGETRAPSRARIGREGLVIDQRYRLDALIGAGGFGEVWRATQQVEGQAVRPVALKILSAPPGSDGTPDTQIDGATRATGSSGGPSGTSWLNEVRAIREVQCPAITTIYDVGIARDPRVAFIAMELLEGTTLDKLLADGPLYWRRALSIAREVATALITCHQVDVVHCDLKPPNIFLAGGGRVCVLDFGIAALGAERAASAPAPDLGDGFVTGAVSVDEMPSAAAAAAAFQIVGTPGYIAPECYTGETPGPAADAFALGVVLYQMIAGRLPYNLPDDVPTDKTATTRDDFQRYQQALNMATTRGDLLAIGDQRRDLPPAVADLVMRLLALDPGQRPTGDLVDAIDEAWRRPYGIPDPPYVGLEAFDNRRTGFIAGRDADISDITDKLRDHPAVVLSGPSGCGKSSLAHAGVAARIDEELLDDLDGWRAIVVRPTSNTLAVGAGGAATSTAKIGVVVVVDQLEELLTLAEADRAAWGTALAALVERSATVTVDGKPLGAADPVRVVATCRDDLFGRVAALAELRRFPERNLYTVRGVEPNAIPAIVKGPAEAAGYTLEDGDDVAAEAARILRDDASALPLVQFALTRWWEQRDQGKKVLPRAEWAKIGGIEGALADAAQDVYESLTAGERDHMRALLIELFRTDGTRVRVAEDQLARGPEARRVLDRLIERRLVRRTSDADKTTRLEVVHEALARRWPHLRAWLEETKAEREVIQDARYDADRWQRAGRPGEMLWRGARLDQAVALAERLGTARAFIDEAARVRARQRNIRRGMVTATIVILAAVTVAIFLLYLDSNKARKAADAQRVEAEQARNDAVHQKEEAETARAQAEKALAARDTAVAERNAIEEAKQATQRALDQAETERQRAEAALKEAETERAKATTLAVELQKKLAELEKAKTELAAAAQRAQAEAARAEAEATKADEARKLAEQKRKEAEAATDRFKKAEQELKRLREAEGIGEPTFP